ncbi:MAG: type II toxin-antitoxin system PemK/MazF family toxin [Acidimicrobiales bacterium]
MTVALPRRGEVWLADLPGDKVRPVVVLTRERVIRHLHAVIVAPVTSTVRGIPSEVPLAEGEGLLLRSVANFDSLQLVPRTRLLRRVGALSPTKLSDACRALSFAVAC